MKKKEIDIILFSLVSVEVFKHDGSYLHDGPYDKTSEKTSGLAGNSLNFLLFSSDNFAKTWPGLCLLFWMKIFEDIEKYSFYLLIGLAVHDIVPVWVFYLLLAYLSVGLGYTSLEF